MGSLVLPVLPVLYIDIRYIVSGMSIPVCDYSPQAGNTSQNTDNGRSPGDRIHTGDI